MKKYSILFIIVAILISIAILTNLKEQDNTPPVYQTVRDLNELQLASATITKMYTVRDKYLDDIENKAPKFDFIERIERSFHFIEHTMKIGDRIGIYGLKHEYAAVMDLSKLSEDDIKISEENGVKKISISLPPVEVRSLGNDFHTEVYHERSSGLRSQISEAERAQIRAKASDQLIADMKNKSSAEIASLRKNGELKAIEFFSTLLQNLGYSPSITIKHSNS